MRTRTATALLTAATAILATTAAITPSFASTAKTWTVTPGGNAVAKSGVIKLTDATTKRAGVCKSSTVDGNLKTGSGLSGTGIGSVTAATFRTCTGPGKLAFSVKASDLPWTLNFASYDPATGVVRGTVSGIRVVISAGAGTCSAVVNGTASSTANGVISAAYTDGTGVLKFLTTGSNLHFWHVKNCQPLLNNGDPATFSGSYTITPKQIITSSSTAGSRHLAAGENSPWPSTDYNAALSRANPTETALTTSTVKQVTYLRSITSPLDPPKAACPGNVVAPVLSGGDLFVMTGDTLSAYDAATGNLLWRRLPDPTYTNFYESLAVSNGLVVVGADDCQSASSPVGMMWAYNATSGRLVWKTQMPQFGPLTAATVSGSFVVASGSAAAGYQSSVLKLSNGQDVWNGSGCLGGSDAPVVVGTLFMNVGCDKHGNANIRARKLATGSVVWTRNGHWALQRGDLDTSAGTHLYATSPAGTVVDLDPQTGAVKYSLSGAHQVRAVDSSRVYATCGSDAFLCAYNISSGALEWQDNQPPIIGTNIAAEAGGVLYTDMGAALDAATGRVIKQVWNIFAYRHVSAIAVGDGRIAVVGDPRVLDLFGLPGS